MIHTNRLIIGGVLAAITTVGLLFFMQLLIHKDHLELDEDQSTKIADIQMGKTDIEVNANERKPDKPDEPEELPPEMVQPELQSIDPSAEPVNITPSLSADLSKLLLVFPGVASGLSKSETLRVQI